MELTRSSKTEIKSLLAHADYDELACNLCGGKDFMILSEQDGLGLPVRTCFCKTCGLIFINPRLQKSWYEKYYAVTGEIRGAYKHGGENPKEKAGRDFENGSRHGRALASLLKQYLKPGIAIDVGSSEGGLLAGIKETCAIEPIGIEPTVSRAEYATSRGIRTYAALIENIGAVAPDLPKAAMIFCTKSLNHFLDPRFFFTWAHERLEEGGRLILEVKNFRQQARMSGRVYLGIQMDHPYMFTPETLRAFVQSAGFEILFFEADEEKSRAERQARKASGLPVGHIRLCARKIQARPFENLSLPGPASVRRIARQCSLWALQLAYYRRYAMPWQNMLKRIRNFFH